MILAAGEKLGPYEVLAPIGAFYGAHDTKLDPDVAIKVLPDAVAEQSDLGNQIVWCPPSAATARE
jgi:hypothetical protein